MSFRRTVFLVLISTVLVVIGLELAADLIREARQSAAFPPGFEAVAPRDGQGSLVRDLLDVPFVLLIAVVVAAWLTRRIARPIQRLTRAADALADAKQPEAVPVPPGDDELSDLARSFNRMSASVHDSLERERAFTRYVSHELRTPLTAVSVQIERAELGLVDADAVIPVVRRQTQRMQEVLDSLLALARSTQRDLAPRALAPLVDEVLASVEDADISLPVPLPSVPVSDAPLLRQALRNLIENVARHASGRAELRVSIRGPFLDLILRDEGPGLPDDWSGRSSRPFEPGRSRSGGSGLGLALVEQVAETLGGELRLRNVPGGLEATLSLPVLVRDGASSASITRRGRKDGGA